MKYGPETKTVEAFLRQLKRITPQEWDARDAAKDAPRAAAWDAAWDAARDAAGAAARAAAWAAAGAAAWDAARAANEIQGATLMRKRNQPFYFLPLFGFADPEAVLAADQDPDAHGALSAITC